jgi:osmoprotectant transport system substrate-binding protein
VLCDDRHAQIVYAPAPLARDSVLAAHPQIAPALQRVFATLSLKQLQQLNARVAVDGEETRAVAADYLKSIQTKR